MIDDIVKDPIRHLPSFRARLCPGVFLFGTGIQVLCLVPDWSLPANGETRFDGVENFLRVHPKI